MRILWMIFIVTLALPLTFHPLSARPCEETDAETSYHYWTVWEPMSNSMKAVGDKDYSLAFSLLQPLADDDNELAQYYLGTLYLYGDGVEKDAKTAVKWLIKSAIIGDRDSAGLLARIYYDGLESNSDLVRSLMWAVVAARCGEPEATSLYKALKLEMTRTQITEAEELAKEWLAKH
jgi:TPR repeat protein